MSRSLNTGAGAVQRFRHCSGRTLEKREKSETQMTGMSSGRESGKQRYTEGVKPGSLRSLCSSSRRQDNCCVQHLRRPACTARWLTSSPVLRAAPQFVRSGTVTAARAGIYPGLLLVVTVCGCAQEMTDQPRVEAYERSEVFSNKMGMRAPVEGTIARGELPADTPMQTGQEDGETVDDFPIPVTDSLIRRGRDRFEIFCAHCHGSGGEGNGIIIKRGFPEPPTFHSERLETAGDGRLFSVITNGFGRMPAFGTRINPRDRWAIIAWVRKLQRTAESDSTTTDSSS